VDDDPRARPARRRRRPDGPARSRCLDVAVGPDPRHATAAHALGRVSRARSGAESPARPDRWRR
jgi:hypothetical protein